MVVLRRALAVLLLLGAAELAWANASDLEYKVKAAFLYNFAKFVEWPSDSFDGPGEPVTLCVLGDDPFGESLDTVVRGESLNGRPFVVHRTRDLREARACHVVFVPASESRRQGEILGTLRGAGVLTVGEGQGFLTDGGVIRFVLDQNRVRFEVNLDAAGAHQLRLSSKLLRLARRVYPPWPGQGG